MACHLTFRQPQQSRLPPCHRCHQPFGSCPTCPLASFLRLFRCGNTQLHLQLPQNKRCTLKTVSLFVARCTLHTPHMPHSSHFGIAIADLAIALISAHTVWGGRGRGGEGVGQRIVATVRRATGKWSKWRVRGKIIDWLCISIKLLRYDLCRDTIWECSPCRELIDCWWQCKRR